MCGDLDMTIEQLRKVHHAQPFRAFVMDLASGKQIRVDHPELLSYSPTGRTVMVVRPEDETFDVVDLLLVTSMHVRDGRAGSTEAPEARVA
jgi:hypothetical protein